VPVGVRLRLFKLAVILFVVVFAVGGALFGSAVVTDLMAKNGTFQTTKRKLERLRNLALFRTPEQKRLLKAYDGPPKAPQQAPRTYYTPKN
jgi:Zn-dependent membrane protease YugP